MNPFKNLAILLLLTALAGVFVPALGQEPPPGKKVYTLYPPINLAATNVNCYGYLTWQKPQMPGGATPSGLVGYCVYKNGVLLQYIAGEGTLLYWDYELAPGTSTYTVTAKYDLTSYGTPGQFGESLPAGPVQLTWNCAVSWPFFEPWDAGTFSFHSWMFSPAQGNWTVNTGQGNPAPTALFNGTPSIENYNILMKGYWLLGEVFTCANIYFEFDYKLTDNSAGGTEKLVPVYYLDTTWYPLMELTNQGSTGWIHQKIDLSMICGHYSRIGFRVSGIHSANIAGWEVDNIYVHAVCKGPTSPAYTLNWNQVNLSWQHPACDSLSSVAGYNVYRTDKTGLPPFSKITASLIQGYAYTDYIPTSILNGQFRYYITDYHKNYQDGTLLCEASSDTLVLDYALGIRDPGAGGIRIYPQPARDNLTVSSDSPVETYGVYSVLGTTMISRSANNQREFSIAVNQLPEGIYLVQIKNASGTFTRKV